MTQPPHEELLLGLSDTAYQLWRHNPVTSAYLKYLEDQYQAFRIASADLLESGKLAEQADVLRGRLLTLRELSDLSLSDIHGFYRKEGNEEDDGAEANQGHAG